MLVGSTKYSIKPYTVHCAVLRCRDLERYMKRLARHPAVRKDPDFRLFLQEVSNICTVLPRTTAVLTGEAGGESGGEELARHQDRPHAGQVEQQDQPVHRHG